jgi:DNA primase
MQRVEFVDALGQMQRQAVTQRIDVLHALQAAGQLADTDKAELRVLLASKAPARPA